MFLIVCLNLNEYMNNGYDISIGQALGENGKCTSKQSLKVLTYEEN